MEVENDRDKQDVLKEIEILTPESENNGFVSKIPVCIHCKGFFFFSY